ncbi:MAG: AraC family transcriptional regulator ligand-binding domain-containing protein [Pseudomonadota bacterium]
MEQRDYAGPDDGLLLHIEHIIGMIRRISGEAFLAKVLERVGLPCPWDRTAAIHVVQHDEAELIRTATEMSGDPAYAARLGINYSSITSVPGYVARNSRTLRSAIQRSKRYTALSSAALDYDMRERGDIATLSIRARDPATDRNFPHREFSVFAVLSVMRYLVDRTFQPVEVTFRHRRTKGAEPIRRASACPVLWDMAEDSIRMTEQTLDLKIPTYDPRQRDLLSSYGETLLARAPRPSSAFRAEVERLILARFTDGAPSAEDIAHRLGMSRRTLTRRLSEQGLTFRQILDDVRLDVAHSYLHDTELSLAEISFQLGYADQAAFTTAYKRWTGKTPAVERAGGAA